MPTTSRQLRAAISEEIAAWCRTITAAFRNGPGDARRIHRGRVAIKRLRAALRLFRPSADPRLIDAGLATLRRLAHALANARDLTARADALAGLSAHADPGLPPETLASALAWLVRGGEPSPRNETLRYARLLPLAGSLEEMVLGLIGDADRTGLKKGFRRARARCERAFERACAVASPARAHAWRKRAKDAHYQAQLLQAVGIRGMAGHARRYGQIAHTLGTLRDTQLIRQALSAVPQRSIRERLVLVHTAQRLEDALWREARTLHRQHA